MGDSAKRVREYLAGGIVALGINLLMLQVIAFSLGAPGLGWGGLIDRWSWLLIPFIVIHTAGGIVGGYLVALRRVGESFTPGVATALIAYILEYIYQLLFEGSFQGSLWAIICLVGGGVFGSLLSESRRVGEMRESIKRIQRALEAVRPHLMELYGSADVHPRELLEYLTGPTTTGDGITIGEILGSRYLMVHEAVEVMDLKRMGLTVDRWTAVRYPSEVYEAHLRAAEVELLLAEGEGDERWLERRLRDVESWLQDPKLPKHLKERCEGLLRRFREKKAEAHIDRLEEEE